MSFLKTEFVCFCKKNNSVLLFNYKQLFAYLYTAYRDHFDKHKHTFS